MQEVHNLRKVWNHGIMSGSRIKYAYDTAPEKIAATHSFKLHQLNVHLSKIYSIYKPAERWQIFQLWWESQRSNHRRNLL